MAPYDVDARPEYEPMRDRWDWWQIYTPPGSHLLVRPGHNGDPRLVHNPVYRSGAPRPIEALCCDGGPVGLLDIPTMAARASAAAAVLWDAWHELVSTHPPAEPLSVILDKYREYPQAQQFKLARAEHLAQPLVQAVAVRAARGEAPFDTSFLLFDPVEHFASGRQEYLNCAAESVLDTFALLRGRAVGRPGQHPRTHQGRAGRRLRRRVLPVRTPVPRRFGSGRDHRPGPVPPMSAYRRCASELIPIVSVETCVELPVVRPGRGRLLSAAHSSA